MENTQVTVEQYQQLLDSHDWSYHYSDDMEKYRKGAENNTILCNLKKGRPELEELFDKSYNKHNK